MNPSPPRWASRLLEAFCAPHLLEEVRGDLEERFGRRVALFGERVARRQYAAEVLSFLRPFALKRLPDEFSQPFFLRPVMLRNYFKIAWRNLIKNRVHSLINVVGLAVGMVAAMLIGLWVYEEWSFDRYHPNYHRIAQVVSTQAVNGEPVTGEAVAIPLANELRRAYASDFRRVALMFPNFDHVLAVGEKKLTQSGVWAEPELPDMLDLQMLKGRRDALNDPSAVLLAQSVATALFGSADPIGKLLRMDNRMTLTVAGVFEDLPANTTFRDTKLFLPWSRALTAIGGLREAQTQWDNRHPKLFVEVAVHGDPAQLSAKIKDLPNRHLTKGREEIGLHPMNRWHLYGEFRNGQSVGGRIQYVWLFGIAGLAVLLMASINFMNLSTARSEKRAKEVGIRKAVGSVRAQLIGQFFTESLLVAGLALGVALLLLRGMLPLFNDLTGKTTVIPWADPRLWLLTLGFTVGVGLVSGSYPAFYLSGFRPVSVLKGTFRVGRRTSLPRQVLVVVQFTVSICLIISTVLVYRQVQHGKNRPVGYTREGLITIRMNTPELFAAPYDALRNDLLRTGMVADMAKSSTPSTEAPFPETGFDWRGKASGGDLPGAAPVLKSVWVTHDFGKTLGWTVVQGRDFSRAFAADSGSYILNEAAARLLGFKNPVGETIRWGGVPHAITGVVKNLVMESPYTPVPPTVFILDYGAANWITVRIDPTRPLREALATVEGVFKKYNPGGAFEYKFTDQEYARKFSDEERIGTLASGFAGLAVFVSCLGLFGLASFMAEQRTKEIGIRKVLGATVPELWRLLSGDFVRLVVVSFLIAAPLAWVFLNHWLRRYAYRTELSGWIFALSGAGALAVTLLTVSFQSVKAALTNPVKSLRSE